MQSTPFEALKQGVSDVLPDVGDLIGDQSQNFDVLSLFVRITRLPKVERDRLLTVLNALLPAPSD